MRWTLPTDDASDHRALEVDVTERTQLIDGDRVQCTLRRRDVDIEECFSCPHLGDVRIDMRHPVIVCRVDLRPTLDELAM